MEGESKVGNHESGTANFAYKSKSALTVGNHFVYVTAIDVRGKESDWSNVVYFDVTTPIKIQAKISDAAVTEKSETDSEPVQKEEQEEGQEEDARETISDKETLQDFIVFAELYQEDKSIRLNDSQYQKLKELLDRKSELAVTSDEISKLSDLLKSKDSESGNKEAGNVVEDRNGESKDGLDSAEATSSKSVSTGGLVDESKNKQGKLGWNAIVFMMFLVSVIAWIFWVNRELIKEKKEQESNSENKE